MTHEKQVEANATLDDNGIKGEIAANKWTKVLKYSLQSLLTEGIDARGVKTTFAYDGLNRVSTVGFTDGTPNITYSYDQARSGFYNKGALTRVETAQGDTTLRPNTPATATEFDYDRMGRVVKHRQSIGAQTYNLEYGYNLAGQLTSEKYPSGKIVSMGYDANGRLANIADQSRTFLSGISFNNQTLPSQLNLGNGTNQTFAYNDRLQMTNQTLAKNSEILQKYDYGYGQIDASGNLDTTKNNGQLGRIESYIGSNKQWTQKFSYDSIGRLSEAKEYRGDNGTLSYKQKFDFDRFGNLYRKQSSNPTAGQATPLAFTPIEDGDISKSTNRFTSNTIYDDAGNVTNDTKFRHQNYWYDANGRMFRTTSGVSDIETNSVYDAAGQRVANRVDIVWTFFIYDAFGKMVAEYGGVRPADDGGVKYILSDWQGSSRAIVNNSGFVKARMDYQAFGEEIYANIGQRTTAQGFNATTNLRQKYGLTERDEATGLDHTWFRKNENKAGRWTSPDPYNGSMNLGNPQSFNRYSYVENQPTNFVDPSGLLLISGWYNLSCSEVWINDRLVYFCWNNNWSPTGSGGSSVGGGAPGESPQNDDKLKNCLEAVEKAFSKPPAVSDDEQNKYNIERELAHSARNSAIEGAGRQYNNSIYWAFVGAAGGAVIGAKFGKIPGAIIGAVVGAGIVIKKEGDAYNITVDQANKLLGLTLSYIKQKHPNAVKREDFLSRKSDAGNRCHRLYRQRKWWENTNTFPIFGS